MTEPTAETAQAPEVSPFTGPMDDPLAGVEMSFGEDGDMFFSSEESTEPEAEPTPTEETSPAESTEPAATDDWETRFKNFQSSVTQKLQRLAELEQRAAARENQEQTAQSSQELEASIRALADEAFVEDDYGNTSVTKDSLTKFVRSAVDKLVAQQAAPLVQELSTLRVQQQMGQETLGLLTTYGERVNEIGPQVSAWIQQYPELGNRLATGQITLTQAFQAADQHLQQTRSNRAQSAPTGQGANTETRTKGASSDGSNPGQPRENLDALQERAQRLQTQEGVGGNHAFGLSDFGQSTNYKTIQDGIMAAIEEEFG